VSPVLPVLRRKIVIDDCFKRFAAPQNWVRLHISGMSLSYVVMLIAFYVDNGKQLPVWKDLPHFTYWLLPVMIASPLIAWALFSHPSVQ
jgi:hypothetical protein